jgi:hypothetical protein
LNPGAASRTRKRKKSWKDRGNLYWTSVLGSQGSGDFRYGSAQNLARETLRNFKIFGDLLDNRGTHQFLYLAHRKRRIGAPQQCVAGRPEFFQKTLEASWLLGNQSLDPFQKFAGLKLEIKFRGNLIIKIG